MILVGIFDRKAQVFISLEPTHNINVAMRQLQELVNTNRDHPVSKWPDDFELYELGTWNNESGVPQPLRDDGNDITKKLICIASALKAGS